MRTHYRTILTVTVLALLSVLPLRAADSDLPDTPSASQSQANQDQTNQDQSPTQGVSAPVRTASKHFYEGAVPAGRGGPLGVDRNVADMKYLGLTGAMFGASVANAELTQRCLAEKTCKFVPSAFTSRAAMYGVGIPADFAVAYMSYRLKKNHNWFWIVPEAAVTGANMFVAIHSWRRLN